MVEGKKDRKKFFTKINLLHFEFIFKKTRIEQEEVSFNTEASGEYYKLRTASNKNLVVIKIKKGKEIK